jgi:hypothetical protein
MLSIRIEQRVIEVLGTCRNGRCAQSAQRPAGSFPKPKIDPLLD